MSLIINHKAMPEGIRNPPSVVQSRIQFGGPSISYSFPNTPTNGNLLVIITLTVQTRSHNAPVGWTELDGMTGPRDRVWYKIASNESNSYPFSYTGGGTNSTGILYEFSNTGQLPITLIGETHALVGSSAESSIGNIEKNHIGVIAAALNNTVSNITIDNNGYDNRLPSSGSSFSIAAYKSYTSSEQNESVVINWTGAAEAYTVFFKVKGK